MADDSESPTTRVVGPGRGTVIDAWNETFDNVLGLSSEIHESGTTIP